MSAMLEDTVVEGRTARQKPWHRHPVLLRVLRIVAVLAVFVVALLTLSGKLPSLADVTTVLTDADTGWLAVAAAAELISMGMFARQQRRLLTAFGVHMPRHRALALAYSRSAIAISLPAGSAISAAYAFRQFRTGGASRRTAATVMVLSGLLSIAALVLLYVTGALAAAVVHLGAAWHDEPGETRGSVLATAALLVFIGLFAWQSSWQIPRRQRAHRPLTTIAPSWLATLLRPVTDAVTSSRAVAGRHWGLALAAALTNWLTDLLCLYAATKAFALPISPVTLGAIYLTVQVVRQIPLTPGGIGVIEISLLAGLVSAGAGEAAAAATVLVYRLLSCWLIIPVGLLGWMVLRRPPRPLDLVDVAAADRRDVAGELRASLRDDRSGVGPWRHVSNQ